MRKEFLFRDARLLSGADAYRFGHILVRDAAYKGAAEGDACRAARAVRRRSWRRSTGDRAAEYEEIIGYHLEQAFGFRTELGPVNAVAAELRERARHRLASAGSRALQRGDLPAALNLFQRSAALAIGVADHAELLIRVGACSSNSASSPRRRRCSSRRSRMPAPTATTCGRPRRSSGWSSCCSRPTPPAAAVRSST